MTFDQEFEEYLKLKKRAEKINKSTRWMQIIVSTRIKRPKIKKN